MNNFHPITIHRAEELWNSASPTISWKTLYSAEVSSILSAMQAAYDAGHLAAAVAIKPLDPLADLTPGTVLRDVTIVGHGAIGDAFISTDTDGPCVATALDWYPLDALTEFTTDDLTIRYTRHGDTWTAESLEPGL